MINDIQFNLKRSEYDAIPYWNQSVVKRWLELGSVPSNFKYWYDHRKEEKQTEACLLGTALDCSKLEHEQFEKRYQIVPKCDRRTKEGKAIWADAEATGKTILTQEQNLTVSRMANALRENQSTADVFSTCKKAVLTAIMFGFPCKGEIDLWECNSLHMWDLKALQDVSQEGFVSAMVKYRYYIQASFYLHLARCVGVPKDVFNFICVANTPPHSVQVHSFSPLENPEHEELFQLSTRVIAEAIEQLNIRFSANDFKDNTDWRMFKIPSWLIRQLAA